MAVYGIGSEASMEQAGRERCFAMKSSWTLLHMVLLVAL